MTGDTALDELERWVASGGIWVVLNRSPDQLALALYTCDGGTMMGEVRSDSAAVREYVGGRERSDD